jgi:rhamnogalacturonan endolyase
MRLAPAVFAVWFFSASYGLGDQPEVSPLQVQLDEPLDRGVIARPIGEGKAYIGWRLLASDPKGVAFNVYRRSGQADPVKLNAEPITDTTDFIDAGAAADAEHTWLVQAVIDGQPSEIEPSCRHAAARPSGEPLPYIAIPLDGQHTFQKAGIADLDGDRRYDFVIKQPNANIDPYVNYWKPSPDTYKLEAYNHDGRFLWRYDLGWSIERGIWYSPYVVYDLDGDGRAEVAVKTGEGDPRDADGRVQTGPEHLTLLDGGTGEPITRIDWPSREIFKDTSRPYNYAARNQLGVAYLDGKTPHLLVERGTYNVIVVVAYRLVGGKLAEVWRWDNRREDRKYSGQGAHWLHAADVDADGRQEVILGSAAIDDDGSSLWSTGLGHPDHCYVGDIDPARPGLEIYYGMETRQKERNGMCLVDAASGKILWGHEGPTRHVHSRGMCSDIDARYPGCECYSADTDASKKYAWSRLRTCTGEVISEENLGGFGALVVHWDADVQRELLLGSGIFNYEDFRGRNLEPRVEGSVIAVADLLGDWREEIVTTVPGQLRIYTTTIPAVDRRVCLMQDPIYRLDVAHGTMGYHKVPMLSYDPASQNE